jgi:hypothetical protein
VDADDDGRRLRLTLLDAHGATLFVGSTDDSTAPWPEPKIDSVVKGWTRSGEARLLGVRVGTLTRLLTTRHNDVCAGVVTMEAAAGVRPAVLKVEKLDREGPLGGDAEVEKRKRAAGAVDYIYSITVTSST